MTEASPVIVSTSEIDRLVGSSGCLVPGSKAKLIDADGNEVTAHETRGELFVQSPSVVLGYLHNERANAETFVHHPDGRWLKTGDVGYVKEDGKVYLVDRVKDLIKVNGWHVSPVELEDALHAHADIKEAAVIGVDTGVVDEHPLAFVVLQHGSHMTEQAVKTHMLKLLARYKVASCAVRFVEAIERNAGGKIDKNKLRQLARASPSD